MKLWQCDFFFRFLFLGWFFLPGGTWRDSFAFAAAALSLAASRRLHTAATLKLKWG